MSPPAATAAEDPIRSVLRERLESALLTPIRAIGLHYVPLVAILTLLGPCRKQVSPARTVAAE